MKALLSRQPGGPETLTFEEVADPNPGKGEVRISVRAVGVNFPDMLIIQDLYQFKPPRPFSPGGELAGIVEVLGESVTSLRVGDRVLVSPVRGAMAEKAVAAAGNCWKIPDAMPFDEAAALLMTYGTSQHALKDRAQLRVGETVRHALAEILANGDVHDPDLEGHIITVPEVRMSPDLKLATIYVMPLGGRDTEVVIEALNRNKKFLRGEIAHRVNLKFAPEIRFRADDRFEEAERIEKLLRTPEVQRDLAPDSDDE